MNETCKICGDKFRDSNGYMPELGTNNGPVHLSCAVQVVEGFIAKQPKEPTLEERIIAEMFSWMNDEDKTALNHAWQIIAMVREHDGFGESNWKARYYDEKARAEAAEAKLAAIRSELST